MIKRWWFVFLFLLSLTVFVISKYGCSNNIKKGNGIRSQTFQDSLGWGYDVLINDTIFIHQNIIPGMPGIHGFKTEEQALAVGNLVVKKMKNSKSFPSVNPYELDSLGIKQ